MAKGRRPGVKKEKKPARKGSKANPITDNDLAAIIAALPAKEDRDFKITKAVTDDGFCKYSFVVVKGKKNLNDEDAVKGKGLVLDDLKVAFKKLRVHLAAADGVFRLQGIDVSDINFYQDDDEVDQYHVDGFEIRGTGDNESVILIGNKYVPFLRARMAIKTPPILMDDLSPYPYPAHLRETVRVAREEVALYREGKCIPPVEDDEDDEDNNVTQLSILSPEGAAESSEADMNDVNDIDPVEELVDGSEEVITNEPPAMDEKFDNPTDAF